MQRVLLCLGAAIGLTALTVHSAAAQQVSFKGKFAVTGGGTCLVSDTGFDNDQRPQGQHYVLPYTICETRVFRSDGTGSIEAKVVATDVDTTGPNGNAVSDATCQFEFQYVMQKGGAMELDITPNHLCAVSKGPRAGETYTLDTFPLVGHGTKQSIALVTPESVLHTQTFSNNDVYLLLCHHWRNGMAIK